MPTSTYWNLPEEKRARVFSAAVEEFSRRRFSEASINRIVKDAAIPRGSFYQYFLDKEDLYLHIMEHIAKEKMEIFSRYRAGPVDGAFLDKMLEALPAVFEWADRCPRYNRIGMLMAQDDSTFIQEIIGKMDASHTGLRRLLEEEQDRGKIRDGVDLDAAARLLSSAAAMLLKEYYAVGAREEILPRIRAMFDIIGGGILRREESHG